MKKLSRTSVFAYGAGDAANSMIIGTANMFLLAYYTDVAGLGAAAAGTLLLVVRLFNAVTDVFAGRIADRSYSRRWGKFRPFLFLGPLPLLLSVAVFHIPQLDPAGKLVYAYLTYAAACLAYSIVNVPYGCMVGAMTQDSRERARLASARTIGGLSIGSALGMFVAPLLQPGTDMQATFTVLTLVFAVVGTGLYCFTGAATREVVERDVTTITFRQSLAALKGNSPLLILCISSVLFLTGSAALGTAQLFYLRNVLGHLEYYPVASGGQVVITLALALLMPRFVQAWGKRAMYVAGGLSAFTGGILVFLVPASAPWAGLAGILLSTLGSAVVNILVWALVADTVEYGQWKTGVRSEGINLALLAATRKMGMAFGGGLAAFALAWGGYAAGAAEQPESAMLGIRAAAGLLPAALTLLAIAAMYWYRLTDQRHAELVADIERTRLAAGKP